MGLRQPRRESPTRVFPENLYRPLNHFGMLVSLVGRQLRVVLQVVEQWISTPECGIAPPLIVNQSDIRPPSDGSMLASRLLALDDRPQVNALHLLGNLLTYHIHQGCGQVKVITQCLTAGADSFALGMTDHHNQVCHGLRQWVTLLASEIGIA